MRKSNFALILFSFIFSIGCSKDTTSPGKSDCETNNYGIVNISFRAIGYEREILATNNTGGGVWRKTIAAGTGDGDTIRLTPGTYHIKVSSPDHPSRPEQDFANTTVTRCQETAIAVTSF